MTLFERLLDEDPQRDPTKGPPENRLHEAATLATVLLDGDGNGDAYELASQTAFLERVAQHAYQAPTDLLATVSAHQRPQTHHVIRPWMWIGGLIAVAAAMGALYLGMGRPAIIPVSEVPTAAAPSPSYAVPAGNLTVIPSANPSPVPTAKEGPEAVPPRRD